MTECFHRAVSYEADGSEGSGPGAELHCPCCEDPVENIYHPQCMLPVCITQSIMGTVVAQKVAWLAVLPDLVLDLVSQGSK